MANQPPQSVPRSHSTEHTYIQVQGGTKTKRSYGDVGGDREGCQLLGRAVSFLGLSKPRHSGVWWEGRSLSITGAKSSRLTAFIGAIGWP